VLTRKPDEERRINNYNSANYNHRTAEETSEPDNKKTCLIAKKKKIAQREIRTTYYGNSFLIFSVLLIVHRKCPYFME
jgi:hypothetical protein